MKDVRVIDQNLLAPYTGQENLDKIVLELEKVMADGGKKQTQQAQKVMRLLGAGDVLTPSQKASG